MVPTGQTVAAVVLALGLARGPSDAQPPTPVEAPDGPEVAAEEAAPSDAAEPTEPEPEPETGAAQPEPETTPETATPPTSPQGAAETEQTEPVAPSAAGTDPPPEDEADESWEDESWEDESWEDDYDPLRDSPEALRAQRRIAGGAVVLGLGAMVSFGGLAMVLSDPCARPAGNSCSPGSRNRAALTMALPGLATVAVGSVMLALGIRQRKALRVDANVNASGGGVSLSGRF